MKELLKFLNTKVGIIILSIIWGLGLAMMFRETCKGNKCIVYKPPCPKYMNKNIFNHNKKCYKYKHTITSCKR